MRDQSSQFSELTAYLRSIMLNNITQTKSSFETVFDTYRKAMREADIAAALDWVKRLNGALNEIVRANGGAAFQHAAKLADTRQLGDMVDLQNAYVRESLQRMATQLDSLRELVAAGTKTSPQLTS